MDPLDYVGDAPLPQFRRYLRLRRRFVVVTYQIVKLRYQFRLATVGRYAGRTSGFIQLVAATVRRN